MVDTKEEAVNVRAAVCVELGGKLNENFLNPVTKETLRGRWERKNVAGLGVESISNLPDIPGLCVVVNFAKRRLRIFDPLAGDNNKQSLAQIKKIWKGIFQTELVVYTAKVYTECDNNTLKTMLMWLRRLVDMGSAKIIDGDLPTFEKINEMQGGFLINSFDSNPESPKLMPKMLKVTQQFFEPETTKLVEPVVSYDGDDDEDGGGEDE